MFVRYKLNKYINKKKIKNESCGAKNNIEYHNIASMKIFKHLSYYF